MMSRPCLSLSLCLPCYFNYKYVYYGAVNRTSSVTIFGSLVTIVYIVVDILLNYVRMYVSTYSVSTLYVHVCTHTPKDSEGQSLWLWL